MGLGHWYWNNLPDKKQIQDHVIQTGKEKSVVLELKHLNLSASFLLSVEWRDRQSAPSYAVY